MLAFSRVPGCLICQKFFLGGKFISLWLFFLQNIHEYFFFSKIIQVVRLSVLQNNTAFRFSALCVWSVDKATLFRHIGRLVASQQNFIIIRFIFRCSLVWYLYACAVEILKYQDTVGSSTDHTQAQVQKIET